MKNALAVAVAASAACGLATADTVTTYDDSLSAGVVIGSGIPNANFVVNTNAGMGVQTGIKALQRFVGDLANTDDRYFASAGQSPVSGAAGAPQDPGKATWNFLWSIDLLGSGLTFADVDVFMTVDFDPAVGNSNVFEFEMVSLLAAGGVDISGHSLFQASENLGFDYWQAIGDPDIAAFDPFALGEYSFSVDVHLNSGEFISGVTMLVDVVPLPGPAGMGATALIAIIGVRRRRALD